MTQPESHTSGDSLSPAENVTHPAIGVRVDPDRMVAARKSAMLERFELAALSGVSRDEIAKLENGKRKRPKIVTLRKLLDGMNKARAERGKPPIEIEDVQVPGEVLIPATMTQPVTFDDTIEGPDDG